MSWALKARLPVGATFSGQIAYPSTALQFPLTNFKNLVQSVSFSIADQYINKYTGFETKKYKIGDSTQKSIDITLVGNLPRWAYEVLRTLAVAMNGAGMIIQFKDNFFTGTTAVPIVYAGRWINAGDFTENSTLLCGGTISLMVYNIAPDIGVVEYQKTIATPGTGLEWVYNINSGAGITDYQRVI